MELTPPRCQSTVPSNHLMKAMRLHPLVFYFLLAFAISWSYELLVFGVLHAPFNLFTNMLVILGPTLAAFLMTAVTQGRAGIRQLLRRYMLWRVGIFWYLVVLLGVPIMLLLPYLIQPGAFTAFRLPGLSYWLSYLIVYVSTLVFGGPLVEEGGWRGFALPRLEQHSGPLVGTMVLGVLWGLWHLPLFLFTPGYNGAGTGFIGILGPFVVFVISVVAMSYVFTWVFNNTRGSLLLAILLHASINTASLMVFYLFPSLTGGPQLEWELTLVWVVVAVLIIAVTRGRLSYQCYQQDMARQSPVTDREQEQGEVSTSA